jgi:hypothetical protein
MGLSSSDNITEVAKNTSWPALTKQAEEDLIDNGSVPEVYIVASLVVSLAVLLSEKMD